MIGYEGNKNVVSSRVREARIRLNLSQGEVAAQLQVLGINIDQQMLSRIEHNLRLVTDFELVGLAYVLKVSVYWLLSGYAWEDSIQRGLDSFQEVREE